MFRSIATILTLVASLSLLAPGIAAGAIIHHRIDYEGTTAGGAVAFEFQTGDVLPGSTPTVLGMQIIPSNDGQNMQIHMLSGSAGGVLIASEMPSYFAYVLSALEEIGPTFPPASVDLPGFADETSTGIGKLTFFGSGSFLDGERGFIGFRFGGGAYYGWAEVKVTGTESFKVFQIAYEDSGNSIGAGDTGHVEGVYRIDPAAPAGSLAEAWADGTWDIGAIMLDGAGDAIGTLSYGERINIGPSYPDSYHPTSSILTNLSDGAIDNRIRVFRKLGDLAGGDVGISYADLPCDDNGELAEYCYEFGAITLATDTSLPESRFNNVGTLPGFGKGSSLLYRGGGGNFTERNWPSGNWFVAAIALDSFGRPIGELSLGFNLVLSGNYYPAFVQHEAHGALPTTARIRVFRANSPLIPGDTGVEFADFPCDGIGAAACDPLSGRSQIDGALGHLENSVFQNTAPVPNGSDEIAFFERTGGSFSSSLGWPSQNWFIRAVYVNSAEQAATSLSPQTEFDATGFSNYPRISIEPFRSPPVNYALRVYRSNSPISELDVGLEYADFPCEASDGSLEPWCDAVGGRSLIGPINGNIYDTYFSQTGTVPGIAVDAPPLAYDAGLVAWPNPFNPRVALSYELQAASEVRVAILNSSGRIIRTLELGRREVGTHQLHWDGMDSGGSAVASGIYHARLVHAGGQSVVKVALVR